MTAQRYNRFGEDDHYGLRREQSAYWQRLSLRGESEERWYHVDRRPLDNIVGEDVFYYLSSPGLTGSKEAGICDLPKGIAEH